jgi:LmbE family N-acetylglucosaminyl deacetylase
MTLRAATATVTLLLSSLFANAQQQPVPQFTDPANLRGERVKPRDGRELPIDQGARGLEQMLRRLNTRASLMLIVAHPDDEDGGMLTYYSRGLGARVAMLTLTRGEGGQNAMTGDFEDALGLLRTQELLSADRYLGVDQFFGTEVDFGFSKTKEEAFKKWTHQRVLYDAVRSIRLFRPLVIAAVFIGGVTDGHGQHQVSGQIAQEAFKAAADPTVFPDMIAEGILPWQALKVYARVPTQSITDKGLFDYATGKYTAPRFENYVTGEVTTTPPTADVIVHEGTTDPLLSDDPTAPPRTYVQFARIGLGMQKSQIGGGVRVPPAGAFDVAYHLYGSALCSSPTHIKDCHTERSAQRGVEGPAVPPAAALPPGASSHNPESASFFDGVDTSIEGIADLAPEEPWLKGSLANLANTLQKSDQALRSDGHTRAADLLADASKQLIQLVIKLSDESNTFEESLLEGKPSSKAETDKQLRRKNVLHEIGVKDMQIQEALRLALGLELKVEAAATSPDQKVHSPLSIRTIACSRTSGVIYYGASVYDTNYDDVADPSLPPHPKGVALIPAVPVNKELHIAGSASQSPSLPYFSRTNIEQPVYELIQPALRNAPTSLPALTAYASFSYHGAQITVGSIVRSNGQPILFVPPGSISTSVKALVVRNSQFETSLKIKVSPPNAEVKQISPTNSVALAAKTINQKESQGTHQVRLHLAEGNRSISDVRLAAVLPAGEEVTEGYRPIGYGDLPRTNYYTPATVRIVPVDLNLPATHRIAYLPGTGDAVPEALASINLKPEILTVGDLTPAKLSQYDTVILGVRTYAAHPDLHGAPTQALLDYARNGGNVLVQYQTAEFTAADAPYPLTLGYAAEKVIDETDPVQLLDAKAPFLTAPNKITPSDFNNWVEERGHGFLGSWDSHYTALTETHDPDQDPQSGGLITTPLGKGRWTYCAFALYRQLPEAVPGAFRLFVNLINPPAR